MLESRRGAEASLGAPLTRDIAARALVTAGGAGSAWLVGRLTGSAERARTIGLVALVGTQLGQTLKSGGLNRPVLVTSLGSAALLGAIVQTPGLSRLFGCQPLGPLGWLTAIAASAGATSLAARAPDQITRVIELWRGPVAVQSADPDLLAEVARAPVDGAGQDGK